MLFYQMTDFYEPGHPAGFRWNDSAFDITWPEANRIILPRGAHYPDFDPKMVEGFRGYP
jgi:dTDP-4-dehydrorhamnose 3,5-epimerase-like enzyme